MYSNKTTLNSPPSDDDVYYYICWRLKLEGETENMDVCTKKRKGVTADPVRDPLKHQLSPSVACWNGSVRHVR